MKINKGMYCYDKSNRKAGIGKIIEFWKNNNVLIEYKNNINSVSKGNVVASFNIIDLIEVGDYVNGKRVDEIALIEDVWFVKTKVSNIDNYDYLPERLIEDIVTKEQFQNCKYVVERNK